MDELNTADVEDIRERSKPAVRKYTVEELEGSPRRKIESALDFFVTPVTGAIPMLESLTPREREEATYVPAANKEELLTVITSYYREGLSLTTGMRCDLLRLKITPDEFWALAKRNDRAIQRATS